ncbi:AMED_5909 family protein [Actinosynnema sp. NPDC023658]|uniref:AMED_5909 family protein n=1 Tax=Actinosynnema sp. NPDC023658 TaxID=3155465 RepID=UPI0033EF48BC
MSEAEELWSAVSSATTLRDAHDALAKVTPSFAETQVPWRDFYLQSAEVYERVAETDPGRRKEALFLAELHREKAEKIAHGLVAWTAAQRAGFGERYTVRLRGEMFGKAVRLAGFHSDYALARAMGLNRSTVKRAREGELRPGPRFISGALKALAPLEFDDLFEVDTHE